MLRLNIFGSVTLAILLPCVSFAAVSVQSAGSQDPSPKTWRRTDGSLMMALRSNAPHFWQWAAGPGRQAFPLEVMKFVGIVAGDAHHENFSHVFMPNGERVYVMNDMDDAGEAPFFLDFLKFLGVSLSATDQDSTLNTAVMYKSYLAGVQGQSWAGNFPKLISDDKDVTPSQLARDYLDKIKKKTSNGTFDKDDGMILSKNLSSTQKRRFDDLEAKWFAKALPAGYEIKDRAIYSKDGGGSGGQDRYWYYLKKSDDDRQMIEFKPLEAPSVQYVQNQQPGGTERLRLATEVFWNGQIPAPFAIVGDSRTAFWMRPRYPAYINLNLKTFVKHQKEFAELSEYIAYRLGGWHGQQREAAGYAQYLASHQDELIKAADQAIQAYLRLAEQNQGK